MLCFPKKAEDVCIHSNCLPPPAQAISLKYLASLSQNQPVTSLSLPLNHQPFIYFFPQSHITQQLFPLTFDAHLPRRKHTLMNALKSVLQIAAQHNAAADVHEHAQHATTPQAQTLRSKQGSMLNCSFIFTGLFRNIMVVMERMSEDFWDFVVSALSSNESNQTFYGSSRCLQIICVSIMGPMSCIFRMMMFNAPILEAYCNIICQHIIQVSYFHLAVYMGPLTAEFHLYFTLWKGSTGSQALHILFCQPLFQISDIWSVFMKTERAITRGII